MRVFHVSPDRLARLLYPETLAFLLGLTALLVVVSLLVRSRAALTLDLKVTRSLQMLDTPIYTAASKWLTFMGNSLTVCISAIAAAAISIYCEQGRAAFFILCTLLALPINILLKNMFDRERPGAHEVRVLPGPRWGFSYPSGHSMGAAAFYGFLAFLIFLLVSDLITRVLLVGFFSLLPIGVGFSRIYLGAHWYSDVVGGLTGGMILVAILAALFPV